MQLEKPVPGIGLNLRRGGAKLRAMGKAHRPLHILLWQAHEVQSSLLAFASSQNTLFTDMANWASSENRALSDVCSTTSELFSIYASAQVQLAVAFKSFRKDMLLVLEGEKRCDTSQNKLQEAESKRLKLRRQLLKAQNRTQVNGENTRRSGDFSAIQTQLAEAERNAERAHLEACEVSKEQEAVKLVVLRTALTKLSQSHVLMVNQLKTIFDGTSQLANEIPEPPAPGDHLACIRYNGFNTTRAIVSHVKRSLQSTFSSSPNRDNQLPTTPPTTEQLFVIDSLAITPMRLHSSGGESAGLVTSTPVMSPDNDANGTGNYNHHQEAHRRSASVHSWAAPEPSAPSLSSGSFSSNRHEPPPPYNSSYKSQTPIAERRSRHSSVSTGASSSAGSHVTTRRRYQNTSSVAPMENNNIPASAPASANSYHSESNIHSAPSTPYYNNDPNYMECMHNNTSGTSMNHYYNNSSNNNISNTPEDGNANTSRESGRRRY